MILFVGFEPKVAALVTPKSQARLFKLIGETKTKNSVDIRDFWQFREFYSPGTYTYNPNGVKIPPTLISLSKPNMFKSVLSFSSPKLISVGGHTKLSSIPQTILPQGTSQILVNKPQTLLIKETQDSYLLIFVRSIMDEKKANGFLQHETDKDNEAGNYWLSITRIAR